MERKIAGNREREREMNRVIKKKELLQSTNVL